jgi:hypothetical protein
MHLRLIPIASKESPSPALVLKTGSSQFSFGGPGVGAEAPSA